MKKSIGIITLVIGLLMAGFGFWRTFDKSEPAEVPDGMRYKVVDVAEETSGWINLAWGGLLVSLVGAGTLLLGYRRK
mgnify:CR=1 FL=1